MFSLIGIPYKHIEQLKFEDFILVKDKIKEKLTSLQVKKKKKIRKIKIPKNIYVCLKELNTKATNEITIRQALSELDVWEFETHFSTINYVDSKGHTIRIINDFKTIFSSVRRMFLFKKKIPFVVLNMHFAIVHTR